MSNARLKMILKEIEEQEINYYGKIDLTGKTVEECFEYGKKTGIEITKAYVIANLKKHMASFAILRRNE